MTKDEALDLALEALEVVEPHTFPDSDAERISRAAIIACQEALASPEQKPMAYGMWDTMLGKDNRMMMVRLDKGQDGCTVPLYTSPPAEPDFWEGYVPEPVKAAQPVALKWQRAPIRTAWGDDMVVASVAIDNDHTLSLYCERDQTPKVDAMFAHRTWVSLTDEEIDAAIHVAKKVDTGYVGWVRDQRREYARAIEAKLRSKNEDRN